MNPVLAEVVAAVTEAQAILQLVADKLHTSDTLPAHDVFTLHAAVNAAIGRLDAVHQATFLSAEPGAVAAVGVVQ